MKMARCNGDPLRQSALGRIDNIRFAREHPASFLISDYFSSDRRVFALGMSHAAGSIGVLCCIILAGYVAASLGWRWACFLIGFPGILIVLVIWVTLREPQRGNLVPCPSEPMTMTLYAKAIVRSHFVLTKIGSILACVKREFLPESQNPHSQICGPCTVLKRSNLSRLRRTVDVTWDSCVTDGEGSRYPEVPIPTHTIPSRPYIPVCIMVHQPIKVCGF